MLGLRQPVPVGLDVASEVTDTPASIGVVEWVVPQPEACWVQHQVFLELLCECLTSEGHGFRVIDVALRY